MDERLASGARGRFRLAELEGALTRHDCLGWADAGRIEVGARADLVAVRTDTVRTAGSLPEQVLLAATAADVDTVVVDGAVVVEGAATGSGTSVRCSGRRSPAPWREGASARRGSGIACRGGRRACGSADRRDCRPPGG